MKKYEFVKQKVKNNVITSATLSEHRGIIEEYASRGYSYKVIFRRFRVQAEK